MIPVCLPSPSYSPSPDSLATVTGFGTTSETASEPSSRLLGVEVRIISLDQCAASNQVYGAKLVSSMLCPSMLTQEWSLTPPGQNTKLLSMLWLPFQRCLNCGQLSLCLTHMVT